MSDLKTPLAKVRGLGSARDGVHHWIIQRITAVANVPLTIFLIVSFVGNVGKTHADWVAWLKQPFVSVVVILFMMNVLYHIRLGLQVAIEDYVKGHGTKVVLLLSITFGCVFLGALSVFSVLRIAFGG